MIPSFQVVRSIVENRRNRLTFHIQSLSLSSFSLTSKVNAFRKLVFGKNLLTVLPFNERVKRGGKSRKRERDDPFQEKGIDFLVSNGR